MSFSTGKPAYPGAIYALLLWTLLGGWFLPRAGSAAIQIEPRVGFDGVFQLGQPFPLEVELSNTERAVEGSLQVQVWRGGASKGGQPYVFYYRKQVFLQPHSRQSVQLTVDPDFISRPLTISFTTPAGTVSREIDLRRHFSPAPVMLLLSEGHANPAIPLGPSNPNRLVSVSLAELPVDARALLGVSTLIVYDQSLRDLSHAQLLALDTWLIAGGRMVILGSINAALYQEPAIMRFLPVRVHGIKKIFVGSALHGAAVARGPREIWAQDAKAIAGRTVIEAQGSPILVEAERGKGRIFYLAIDIGRPPLAQWEGLPDLFKNILTPPVGRGSEVRTAWDEAVFLRLFVNPSFISTYVPTRALFVAIIAYLSVLCFAPWFWQRWSVGPRRRLVCLLVFVTLCSMGGYLYFSRGGSLPDGVLVSSTLLENVADGYVEAHSNIGLFSTQSRGFDLRMESGWIDLLPVGLRGKAQDDPAMVSYPESRAGTIWFPLREWDYRLLKLRFVERFPVYVAVERQPGKIILRVNHQGRKELTDCWLVLPGQRYFLGTIMPGSSWTREFTVTPDGLPKDPEAAARPQEVELRDIRFAEQARDILFHSSFFARDLTGGLLGGGSALFFGWLAEPRRRVWVEDPRVWTYEQALFRAIMPLGGEEEE